MGDLRLTPEGGRHMVCARTKLQSEIPATLGKPVAMTAIFFVVALLLLPFGEETRGKGLPARPAQPPARLGLRCNSASRI